ncbi:MAG: hypothetical protein ACLQU3_05925 [Limisphaerales bacterium]
MTEQSIQGDWRIVVTEHSAAWPQRVVVTGAANGTQILAGNPGLTLDVSGVGFTPWLLTIEHNDGSGWKANSLIALPPQTSGSSLTWNIESDDGGGAGPGGDQDFNDLIIRLEKLGMVDQPVCPFAIYPATMQEMPEGVFEASLGRYFMAVTVCNIWTQVWPAQAAVGLTARCRSWLQAGGVIVNDNWTTEDQAALGQQVSGGRVLIGALGPWESTRIYFKVDVSAAQVRKHLVEIEVLQPSAEDLDHLNRKARATISVTRTTYDAVKKVFIGTCDKGTLTADIKKLTVDYNSLKQAVAKARAVLQGGSTGSGSDSGCGCSKEQIELIRRRLLAFLEGKETDICGIWRELTECCFGGCNCASGGGRWVGVGGSGVGIFAWPTLVEYRVDYNQAFPGQYGPIPFDDPWWKLLLILIAIILSIAAAVSAMFDLADKSDSVVIGPVGRAVLNAFDSMSSAQAALQGSPPGSLPGTVDCAVVQLNGKRGLTSEFFSYMDASSNEMNTTPIVALGGNIDTTGATLTNDQIEQLFQNLADNPGDATAAAALKLFKSGARSGITHGILTALTPVFQRGPEEDGSTIFMVNQLTIFFDPAAPEKICMGGDSGSLWMQSSPPFAIVALNHAGGDATVNGITQTDGEAGACRIEDVMTAMNIRFA